MKIYEHILSYSFSSFYLIAVANTSFTVSIASLTSTIMCRAAMLILYRINQHLCILPLEMEEIRKVLLEGTVGCIFQMPCLVSTACFPSVIVFLPLFSDLEIPNQNILLSVKQVMDILPWRL